MESLLNLGTTTSATSGVVEEEKVLVNHSYFDSEVNKKQKII